jgi:FHA domain/Double zinc ribbon
MAGLRCVFCHADNQEGDQLCWSCFRKLPVPAEPVPPGDTAADAPAPVEDPARCPHCGQEVPDPQNLVCVECHRPLAGTGSLRLSFPGGTMAVDTARSVALGRDPANSPVAGLFAGRDNISRLHATVGVDQEGAWVRDEESLNGTYVNDVPVPPGTRIGLADGDTLRLAADITATVRYGS